MQVVQAIQGRSATCGCLSCFLKYTFKRGKVTRKPGTTVKYKDTLAALPTVNAGAGNFPLDPTVEHEHDLTAGETIHQ